MITGIFFFLNQLIKLICLSIVPKEHRGRFTIKPEPHPPYPHSLIELGHAKDWHALDGKDTQNGPARLGSTRLYLIWLESTRFDLSRHNSFYAARATQLDLTHVVGVARAVTSQSERDRFYLHSFVPRRKITCFEIAALIDCPSRRSCTSALANSPGR